MMRLRSSVVLACVTAAWCAASVTVLAGPLSPPAGAVSSTGLTLSDVEPRIAINPTNTPGTSNSIYRIAQPGSYYLTGNLQGVSGKRGIEIASSDVTIDLRGFEVIGVASPFSFSGIQSSVAGLRNITVRNGTVRGWTASGIDFNAFAADGTLIESVRVDSNTSFGIRTGLRSIISGCSAMSNAGGSFGAADGCVLTSCTASGGSGIGFLIGSHCVVTQCTVVGGTTGFNSLGTGNSVSYCSARQCSSAGFSLLDATSIDHCVARECTGTFGFSMGPGCVVTDCIASLNTSTAATSGGFSGSFGSRFVGCVAFGNTTTAAAPTASTGMGFSVASGSIVRDCTADANSGDGIRCTTRSLITGNMCDANGTGAAANDGAGIHITGAANHVEQNHCTGSDRGIDVDVAGSVIVRNTCSANSLNYTVVANNTILVVIAANAGAVSGDSGGVAPGSTDPNANFTR